MLSEGEARAVAERALSEGRIARDSLACALPPSRLDVTPGDLLAVRSGETDAFFRIDRIEEAGHRSVNAVRIEAGVYEAPVQAARTVRRAPVLAAQSPVDVEFLDLPLLTGNEDPIAPHVAVARTPWAGPVAVFSADNDYGYVLDREVKRPAVFGTLIDPLPAARPGVWMRAAVRIRVAAGTLQSRGEADVLSGANAAALRFGTAGDWEVVQFLTAELVAPREYLVGGFLRGQAGTDGVMPDVWPAGTDFVLLDGAVGQLRPAAAARAGASGTFGSARPYAPTTIRATSTAWRLSPVSACGRTGRCISAPGAGPIRASR